jgi:iron complex transport system substrate-binding protein
VAAELIRRGYPVVVFNQRTIDGILQMIRMLGGLVGCADGAEALASRLEQELDALRKAGAELAFTPRVFFEEWDEPLISGIRWVEELIAAAGGSPVFPELADSGLAKDRIVDPEEVIRRNPDVIVASWCGKPVRRERIEQRAGWDRISAVRRGHIYEIKSTIILQPGPAALTDGVRELHGIFRRVVANADSAAGREPGLETDIRR